MTFHPIPSPLIGGVREREPEYRHLRKVAHYGPIGIHYSHDEDCDNYDVLHYSILGQKSAIAEELLEPLMKAHAITLKELIEQAPKFEDA